jgi:hypothetical protein
VPTGKLDNLFFYAYGGLSMKISMRLSFVLFALTLATTQIAFPQSSAVSNTSGAKQGLLLDKLFFHRSSKVSQVRLAGKVPDPLALGLARRAKVYKFATADYPGADASRIFDTNTQTQVGAFEFTGAGPETAFTVKGNVYQILDIPGSRGSVATTITTAGVIGGVFADTSGLHGFIDQAGTFTSVDVPGADITEVADINDNGAIVGDYIDTSDHGYVDNNGVFTAIDVPGAIATAATSINSNGDIVGIYTDATTTHSFLLKGGTFTTLDFPLSTSTSAFGINDSGEIAGNYNDVAGVSHGFTYSGGAWSTVDVVGATAMEIHHLKNNGVITGDILDDLGGIHGIRGR